MKVKKLIIDMKSFYKYILWQLCVSQAEENIVDTNDKEFISMFPNITN